MIWNAGSIPSGWKVVTDVAENRFCGDKRGGLEAVVLNRVKSAICAGHGGLGY